MFSDELDIRAQTNVRTGGILALGLKKIVTASILCCIGELGNSDLDQKDKSIPRNDVPVRESRPM